MLDAVLLVVVGIFVVRGFWRGFIRETVGLVALLASGIAAALFAGSAGAALVAREVVRPEIAPATGGAAVFLATWVGVNLVGLVLDKLARALFLGPLLRIAGMVFAAVKGALLLGLALLAGQRVVPSVVTAEAIAESRLAGPMMTLATVVLDFGGQWIGAAHEGEAAA